MERLITVKGSHYRLGAAELGRPITPEVRHSRAIRIAEETRVAAAVLSYLMPRLKHSGYDSMSEWLSVQFKTDPLSHDLTAGIRAAWSILNGDESYANFIMRIRLGLFDAPDMNSAPFKYKHGAASRAIPDETFNSGIPTDSNSAMLALLWQALDSLAHL